MEWFKTSPLATAQYLTTNYTIRKSGDVLKYFIPHCMVGQLTAKGCSLLKNFQAGGGASAHYLIGTNGEIAQNVYETYRAWTTGGDKNVNGITGKMVDFEAITVECASDIARPQAFNASVYASLLNLCEDVARRYNKYRVIWLADPVKSVSREYNPDELIILVHRWFASKECPGNWLFDRLGDFASEVTARLNKEETTPAPVSGHIYRVQVGAFKNKENAERLKKNLLNDGYDAFITEADL